MYEKPKLTSETVIAKSDLYSIYLAMYYQIGNINYMYHITMYHIIIIIYHTYILRQKLHYA